MKELGTMLQVNHVSKLLGDKLILRNLSFTAERGETVAVLGPNGAGKSTAFKCISGLLKPTEGDILINGKSVKDDKRLATQRIGYLGHDSFLYSHLSPVENLQFYAKLYHLKQRDETIQRLLKQVGLHYFKDTKINSFSRGMLQRLSIARVLLTDPEILLLDEPHTGLDQEATKILNQFIEEKQQSGMTVLLITHDFDHALALADKLIIIAKGKVEAEIAAYELADVQALKTMYEQVVNGK